MWESPERNHLLPGLVNVYITMVYITIFNGKTHYFDWAIFNSYVRFQESTCDKQPINSGFEHGLTMIFQHMCLISGYVLEVCPDNPPELTGFFGSSDSNGA